MSNSINKPKYGAANGFFKKGGWLYALVTLLFVNTVIYCNYTFNLLGSILEDQNLMIFTFATIGYVVLIGTYYVFLSPRLKSTSFAFSIGIGLMLSGLVFVLYTYLELKVFTLVRILIAAGLFALGLVYVIASCLLNKKETENYGYYLSAVKKFSFAGIFCLAVIISCVFYLLTKKSFIDAMVKTGNGTAPVLLMAYIFIALAFLTTVVTISSKKTEVLDIFLLSTILALPECALISVFICGAPEGQIVFLSIACGIVLLLLLARKIVFFNKNTIGIEPVNAGYFRAFLSKYSFLAALTIGVGAFLVMFTFFSGAYVSRIIDILWGKMYIQTIYVPIFFIVLCTVILMGMGFGISMLTVNAKRICFGDFFNVACIAMSAAALPYTFMYLSILWLKIAIFVFVTISAIILISRIRSVKY
ncbi:MAG: hypothetical protein SPL13_00405 [Clostridia bacterium]|nr:hypothetical protein [Clostridia bacterium]